MHDEEDTNGTVAAARAGLGPEAANALLEEFEAVDRDRLATEADIAGVKGDLAEVRRDLREGIDDVRHSVDLLRTEMDGRFAEMDGRFAAIDERVARGNEQVLAAVRGEMIDAIATQTRTMQYTLAGTMLTVLAVAATLATLL